MYDSLLGIRWSTAVEGLFSDLEPLFQISGEKAEKNIQEAMNYIRLDLRNAGEILSRYNPLEIMKMAVWEERRIARQKPKDQMALLSSRLLPVMLQSVAETTLIQKDLSRNRDIKSKDWNRIVSIGEDLTRRLLRFIDNQTVLYVRQDRLPEADASQFREALFCQLFPPVEDMDSVENQFYRFKSAAEVRYQSVKDTFSVDPEMLTSSLRAIAERGINGIDRLTEEVAVYKAEMELEIAKKRT